MTPLRLALLPALLSVILATTGCGGFVARRISQAPNTYPGWLGPDARVELSFSSRLLAHFPARIIDVGPSPAQLTCRIIEPADYHLQVTSTNWVQRGRTHFQFAFDATVPGQANDWTPSPRGTVVLLHGHGLAQFSTAPWALRLAEEGWRCVLVDLRGHGASSGNRVYFGVREIHDLSQLVDALERDHQLSGPLAALGESYGAALALRWKMTEPRISRVIAIAPYARLSSAILNIRREYAGWVPRPLIAAGLRQLPALLKAQPHELDPLTALDRDPVAALFVAGGEDKVTPAADVRRLYDAAALGSEFVEVPNATHEALPYFLDDLVPPVLAWLNAGHGNTTTHPSHAYQSR